MGLIGKLVIGKTAADLTGKKARKVEKDVKKKVRQAKKTIALMLLAFCAGVGVTCWFLYGKRKQLAVMAIGRRKIKRRGLKKLRKGLQKDPLLKLRAMNNRKP